MIELGRSQTLIIKRFTTVGAFLNDESDVSDDILLPRKFVKKEWQVGKKVDVFVYKDNENRPIATTIKPKLELGQLAILQVIDVNKVGAFLDWGLEKDLYLPYEEQTLKVKKHEFYLVSLYVDASNRLTATMKVSPYFSKDVPYKENDWIEGNVYSFDYDIGAFILVDNKYNAMLPSNEIDGIMKINDRVKLRVKNVKSDGKIDLTKNNRFYEDLGSDSEKIYNILRDNGGYLKVGDHSNPKLIYSIFNMSKSQFKRSLGRLYKQRRIIFVNDGIKINDGGKNGR